MCTAAARSASAVMVSAAPCEWLGARHARLGPVLVAMARLLARRGMPRKTYGTWPTATAPLLAGPPVVVIDESQPTTVPSFLAAIFTVTKPDGRLPAASNS